MKSLTERRLLKTMTESLATRSLNLPAISPETNTRKLRRIVYYAKELKRTFTYITNALYISAKDIAMLYKKRWQVELFFKWIKQHLYIKTFWGNSENAVRIQIYSAICAYCLVAIAEHDCHLNRSLFDVLRVLRGSLIDRHRSENCSKNRSTIDLKYVKTSAFLNSAGIFQVVA